MKKYICLIIVVAIIAIIIIFGTKYNNPNHAFYLKIVTGSFLYIILAIVWLLICDKKATQQRNRIIYYTPNLYKYFDNVTYAEHLEKLLYFRNPFKLYTEEWQKIKQKQKIKKIHLPVNPENWWS